MFFLHEVVDEVPEEDGLPRVAAVQERDLHVGVRMTDRSMEGTVYQEYSEPLRMVGSNRSPDIGQLLLPSLPELFSVLVAIPDGGVRGAVEQQDRGRDVGVGRGGADTVITVRVFLEAGLVRDAVPGLEEAVLEEVGEAARGVSVEGVDGATVGDALHLDVAVVAMELISQHVTVGLCADCSC